jgi:folate-dependent phosphoribosylglycinamide formyltransferase PurN
VRSEPKRIAILTRDGAEHRYVVNALCARIAIDRIIVDRKPPKANIRRAMRQGLKHFLGKAARTGFLKLIDDDGARVRSLQRLLGKNGEVFNEPDKLDYVDGINSSETIARLKEVDPDAILVYGTSVVKDAVLGLARDICFNMHTGISPYYRGTACAFWPVVSGELEMLGATIHECTSRIDGGAIFETAHTACEPGDDLHAVFGRAVIAGADAYVRVAERYLAGTLEGKPQDLNLGREYRGSELTLGPELAARRRLARLKTVAKRRHEQPT